MKRSSSRERLQKAARTLFAERGYEATTVAAIVKSAGTSYSQFIAHFGDKPGVLSTILREGWGEVNSAIRLATGRTSGPADRLRRTIDVLLSYLERDQHFRTLCLIESTASRHNGRVSHHDGLSEFLEILDGIFQDMRSSGELAPGLDPRVLRSAMMGALEGMLRDQLVAEQSGTRGAYSEDAMAAVLTRLLAAVKGGETVLQVPVESFERVAEAGDEQWIGRYLDLAALALGRPGTA